MTILDQLADCARERTEQAKKQRPLATVREQAERLARNDRALEQAERLERDGSAPEQTECVSGSRLTFEAALRKPGLSFICECKKASPSKGLIAPDFPYLQIAKEYEAAGADAISVLTEPRWFLGSDAYLEEIAAAVRIPCLRKDFTVDEYMIYEAKLLGASAVLLICSILDEGQLRAYLSLCDSLGLSALTEVHDGQEAAMAVQSGARIIGVNNRNLKDFTVDTGNSRRLREEIPEEILFVSESGVGSAQDVAALRAIGADAVLVGETLMRAADKKAKLAWLRGGERL